jgi:hypothetical protein
VPFRLAFSWDVLELVTVAAYLNFAWLCAGSVVLKRLGLTRAPALERLALAGPLGATVFLLGFWFFGAVGALGPWAAVSWPLVMILVGVGDARRALSAFFARWRRDPLSALELACFAGGVLLLCWIWLGVLTPDAINYDASWNHLVIAQDYAREGRIVGFRADWVKNLPHAGSVINTWAFVVPGFDVAPLRWMLALQLEFFALLWTLVGVSAVASRMLLHRGPRALWSALALFPAILVYDSNLGAAADHYLAFFCCAVVLTSLRFASRLDRRWGIVAGVLLGVSFATKMQAAFIAAPVGVLLGVALLRRRASLRAAAMSLLMWALAAVAMVLPHLLRNLLAFRNPVYPLAQDVFGGVPSVPDAALQVKYLFADWRTHPPGSWQRLGIALEMLATFSFKPHYSFIGDLPMFGSLFTLLTPTLLFVRKRRALLPVVLLSYGALFTWALLVWVDRNLQGFAPWLWASTAAMCVSVWRLGWPARAALLALVGVQLIWATGLDTTSNDRVFAGLRLFQGQTAQKQDGRWAPYRAREAELDRTLPKDAVVLLHDDHVMLGINRPVLCDWIGFQGLFDYRPMTSVTDLVSAFAAERVTHVAWHAWARLPASRQEEVLFTALAILAARVTDDHGGLAVFELSRVNAPPRPIAPWRVLTLGVPNYADGVYDVTQLGTCEEYPPELMRFAEPLSPFPSEEALAQVLSETQVVFVADPKRVSPSLRGALIRDYVSAGPSRVYVRRAALGP